MEKRPGSGCTPVAVLLWSLHNPLSTDLFLERSLVPCPLQLLNGQQSVDQEKFKHQILMIKTLNQENAELTCQARVWQDYCSDSKEGGDSLFPRKVTRASVGRSALPLGHHWLKGNQPLVT